ncbi:2-amino-4-hydroxy-6-hydroxymethyldihydropteridine diphosphokinase [bacterium]|nr:2-amino-4-hydroxy-6-hydroxymethyldihydropteridine diphosphokinase [bacterium]
MGDVKAAFAKAIRTIYSIMVDNPRPQADTGTSLGEDGDSNPRPQANTVTSLGEDGERTSAGVCAPDGSASRDDRLSVSRGSTAPAGIKKDTGTAGVMSPIRCSRLYSSSPWGVSDQPDFLNMAISFPWAGTVESLFDLIRRIERDAGRHRPDETRWGPRRLDIDILVFGEQRIEQEALTVPHPRLHERRFVLQPLLDLLPGETVLPGYQQNLTELLTACSDDGELRALGDQPWTEWRETEKRS